MALSMDEQRLLAEIERGLAGEDPVLAARLSAFKHPGIGLTLRLRRARLLASLASLIAVAVVSIVAYLFVPFAHRAAPARSQLPGQPAITETGARTSPATGPRGNSSQDMQKYGLRKTSPGSSISAPGGSAPSKNRTPASGAAGSSQNRAAPAGSKAPSPSRSGGNPATGR
jgi:hypothetical protein